MKKIFVFFIFLFLVPGSLLAQNKTADDYYQELWQNYRLYQEELEPFNTKKSQHLAYQSVTTQAELFKASQNLVLAEIEAIGSYVNFVKTSLAEATSVINYQENYLYIKLNDKLDFLKITKEKIKNASSLNEIDQILRDLSSCFEDVSQMGYQVKAIIETGSARKIFSNLEVDKTKLKDYLSTLAETPESLAAKERFQNLEKEMTDISVFIEKAENLQKKVTSTRSSSTEIREEINKAVSKMFQVLAGFKNIVFSLKK